jgi:hypothetical protein
MNSSYIRLQHLFWVILDKKSKIQEDWNKCYIVCRFFEDVYSVRF